VRYRALLDEAKIAAQRREFQRAESLTREVLAARPEDVGALDLLGYVLYFQDRVAEAEAICRETLRLRPDHPYALKGLGLCLAKTGDLPGAIASIERAIDHRPAWFDPYWDLAVTLLDAGRAAEAIAVVQRGRAALPDRERDWDRMERHARATGARALGRSVPT
jgi:predicted Zn-dependent protease